MPALRSKIKPTSDTFAANALRMKEREQQSRGDSLKL